MKNSVSVPFAMHAGNSLRLAANQYPTLLACILELFQNALDSFDKPDLGNKVVIKVNLFDGTAEVCDNGSGLSRADFAEAMSSVVKSIKKAGKLGRYGLGLMSPINKCKVYTLVSTPCGKEKDGYLKWTFESKKLLDSERIDAIPGEAVDGLAFSVDPEHEKPRKNWKSKGLSYTWWRTRVQLKDITEDRQIRLFTPEDLVSGIQTYYSDVIRRLKIAVKIVFTDENNRGQAEREVVPLTFTGKPLPVFEADLPKAGHIRLELYLARAVFGQRKGKVQMGILGDEFRLKAEHSRLSLTRTGDQESLSGLFCSGVFEGLVQAEKIEMAETRRSMRYNDALAEFGDALAFWFKENGAKYLEEVKAEVVDFRRQELALRSAKLVEHLLQQEGWKSILDKLELGTIGQGHKRMGKDQLGKGETTEISVQGSEPKKGTGDERGHGDPKDTKENHHPVTVAGPQGKRRILVKIGSTGLCIGFSELASSLIPFEIDFSRGLIEINTRHPWLSSCERLESTFMRYVEAVCFSVISLLQEDESNRTVASTILDRHLKMMVFSILNGDQLTGRRKGAAEIVEV